MTSPALFSFQYNDPEIAALGRKVRLVGEADRKIPKIEVTCRGGQRYSIEGHNEGAVIPNDKKIKAKFMDLTSSVIGEATANEIVDIVANLDKHGSIQELTQKLRS